MRGPQDTRLDTLLEDAILEKVERVAEALSSGKEVMDAKQAADFLRIMLLPHFGAVSEQVAGCVLANGFFRT